MYKNKQVSWIAKRKQLHLDITFVHLLWSMSLQRNGREGVLQVCTSEVLLASLTSNYMVTCIRDFNEVYLDIPNPKYTI